jgi:hypothetical protein
MPKHCTQAFSNTVVTDAEPGLGKIQTSAPQLNHNVQHYAQLA